MVLEDEMKKKKENAPIVAEVFKDYDMGDYTGSVQTADPTYEIASNVNPKVQIKTLSPIPSGNTEVLLQFVLRIVKDDYDMPTLAQGFDLCRENLRQLDRSADYIFELSKMALLYGKQQAGLGLNLRDKERILEKTTFWYDREVNKRLEEERIEKERIEAEERERVRIEQERVEGERRKKEFMENKRLEHERLEAEKLERERLEAERLEKERIQEEKRLDAEKIEREQFEAERLEQEQIENERIERERIEREGSFEFKIKLVEEDLGELKEEQSEWKARGKELKKEIKVLSKKLKKLQKAQAKSLK